MFFLPPDVAGLIWIISSLNNLSLKEKMTSMDYKLPHYFASAGQIACGEAALENTFVEEFCCNNGCVSII